jgi:hypothetical protein
MDKRYLNDENMQPLQYRIEGDAFIIRSIAGWEKDFRGLDARR